MKASDKMRVYWSKKEEDLMFYAPLGFGTTCDTHWLYNNMFLAEFTNELTKRGYDIATIKFSIEPLNGEEKFSSQREKK